MLSHDDQLLISSYIDGEVSPDERVRAEQLLVDDAAARAYREELLSMSAGLKSLPQHTLPADFADDVLAAAERAMFTGEPWPGDTNTESPSLATRVFNSRTIAYAGATIAAALLVALFLPSGVLENNPNENVAHKAEDEDKSEAPAGKAQGNVDKEVTAKRVEQKANEIEDNKFADKDKKSLKALGKAGDTQEPSDEAPFDALATKSLPRAGVAPGGGGAGGPQPDAFGASPSATPEVKERGTSKRHRKNTEPPLMVVSMDIGEVALRDGTLQRVLAAHRVPSKESEATGFSAVGRARRDAIKKAAKKDQSQLLAGGPSTQTVYAEMSRSQLSQVLAQLKTDPKGFSSVELYGGSEELRQRVAVGSIDRLAVDDAKLALSRVELEKQAAALRDTDKAPGAPGTNSAKPRHTTANDRSGEKGKPKDGGKQVLADGGKPDGKETAKAEIGQGKTPPKTAASETKGDKGRNNSTWRSTTAEGGVASDQRVRVLFVLRTPGESVPHPP